MVLGVVAAALAALGTAVLFEAAEALRAAGLLPEPVQFGARPCT
jgi:hypothetical protein